MKEAGDEENTSTVYASGRVSKYSESPPEELHIERMDSTNHSLDAEQNGLSGRTRIDFVGNSSNNKFTNQNRAAGGSWELEKSSSTKLGDNKVNTSEGVWEASADVTKRSTSVGDRDATRNSNSESIMSSSSLAARSENGSDLNSMIVPNDPEHGQNRDVDNSNISPESRTITKMHDEVSPLVERENLSSHIPEMNPDVFSGNQIMTDDCEREIADSSPVSHDQISVSPNERHCKAVENDVEILTYSSNNTKLDSSEQGKHSNRLIGDVPLEAFSECSNLAEQTLHVHKSSHGSVTKTFTTDANLEEDDDEPLREHWTRTLEGSASTGDIVEEIVRVLKQQNSHDLLCPVCGSCVTKRVILRKRKRTSVTSVKGWYQEHVEFSPSHTVSEASVEDIQEERQVDDAHQSLLTTDDQDTETEAYGCMSCFSLFFRKVIGRMDPLPEHMKEEDDKSKIRCLPFFFPPYPWGTSQTKTTISETASQHTIMETEDIRDDKLSVEREEQLVVLQQQRDLICGLAHAVETERQQLSSQISILETECVRDDQPTLEREDQPTVLQQQLDLTCGLAPILIPDYSWGVLSKSEIQEEESQSISHSSIMETQTVREYETEEERKDGASLLQQQTGFTFGLTPSLVPDYPWGVLSKSKAEAEVKNKQDTGRKEAHDYLVQGSTLGSCVTTTTSVVTMTTHRTYDLLEELPKKENSSFKLDHSNTIMDTSLQMKASSSEDSTAMEPIQRVPSTGFAALDIPEIRPLANLPSTGYAVLQDLEPLPQSLPKDVKGQEIQVGMEKVNEEEPSSAPKGMEGPILSENLVESKQNFGYWRLPTFSRFVGKIFVSDELKKPLLQEDEEQESISEDIPKTQNWLSSKWLTISWNSKGLHKLKSNLHTSLASVPESSEQVSELNPSVVEDPVKNERGRVESIIQIDYTENVQPTTVVVRTAMETLETPARQDSERWEILRSIVYGGLDISIASLGVVSSAAGGDAITRTVVYMGLAILVSGIVMFYHSIIGTFQEHRDHYRQLVGDSLRLHGTVAVTSYFVSGLLAPITYAFAFRESDNKDYKFATTCGVSSVVIILLSLGKARVSQCPYLKTVISYVTAGVLSTILGYVTGEHVSKLLEQWGF